MTSENKQKEEKINGINLSWKAVIYSLTAAIEKKYCLFTVLSSMKENIELL